MRGEVEVDYMQSVGEWNFYLTPYVKAEKWKVSPWKYHGGLIPQSSNSTVGESKFYLAEKFKVGSAPEDLFRKEGLPEGMLLEFKSLWRLIPTLVSP